MTTKIIGIKQFRQKITSLWKEARENNVRYIVLYHSKPIFEVNPIDEDELILEKYASDIAEAREQTKNNEVYSSDETRKELRVC